MQSLKELPEIRLSLGQVTVDHLVTKCKEIFSYAIFMDTEEDWLYLFPAQRKGTEAVLCGTIAGTRVFQTHQR